ncbi:endonuclease [Streptomyces sp. Z26]|uniref:endonuclease n=1 Tax=Streptomyces sp. Z26 TaxID=2500177 RepID=UPI000EF16611|nr:endonuclease [Streptomyces sp. Z26]RLL65698.1 endonuclease [Streptomyces sp. Z26]
MSGKQEDVVRVLLRRHGRTYASEAGVTLRDTPAPLYQVLVLSHLLSARIRAGIAVAAARALFDAGYRDARRMAGATWQQRVDALGAGGYRRYDERTSTQLGEGAELLRDRYGGDLRRVREAGVREVPRLLREFPGIGPTGVDIFLREVQGVWPEFAPCFGAKARDGADRLDLPRTDARLARLVPGAELPRLAAGLVRVALDAEVGADVRESAGV